MNKIYIEMFDSKSINSVDYEFYFLPEDHKDSTLVSGDFVIDSKHTLPNHFAIDNMMDMLEHVIIPSIEKYGQDYEKLRLKKLVNKMGVKLD